MRDLAAFPTGLPAAPKACLPENLRLRLARRVDLPFLLALYGSVRAPELQGCSWPQCRQEAFITDQFRLQHTHYLRAYSTADYWVVDRIEPDGAWVSIGRLSLDRSSRDWHLIELSLVAIERGRGRGTALIRWVQRAGAVASADSVGLHVARDNPGAIRLYARMGFRRVPSHFSTHARLCWTP
ncbi:GNAT family protein [Sphingomonas sp. TREG-RG-20F-R18-01]|uniref:GNAT family N-acetyltransferase n=1 Tax=Sphingomonas sp. TREG-RG-20F-R18-01 TaxID=2914982 RepID=UPI001F57A238|nr:GNAT family protein [Sphingomonas sp. TREG-RG-20F-R18-01]